MQSPRSRPLSRGDRIVIACNITLVLANSALAIFLIAWSMLAHH